MRVKRFNEDISNVVFGQQIPLSQQISLNSIPNDLNQTLQKKDNAYSNSMSQGRNAYIKSAKEG